ncbi:metal-dependent hydrolase [Stenotrophomonas sp.]|uniref:metal-dependent hydrolase n=1 Tax=Stenotrophomonas sp. TaxID=69392 RepID=UPI00289D39BB|nr:metal-dependent hydrolase [Stenotrophomonas sp.]
MSSLVGHACAGLTAYLCWNARARAPSRWAMAPFVFVAVCPDLDYLAVWLLGYGASPRVTHSLLFALIMAVAVNRVAKAGGVPLAVPWLLAASGSHPLLDLLVGAHPVPLFWPLQAGASLPGVLPSAGALKPGNVYLWRNLLIELGVLLPVFTALVALARGTPMRRWRTWAVCVAPVWVAFVAWSISLPR